MTLLQVLSFLEVFIHIFSCLVSRHAPGGSTQTFYQFSVYFSLRNVSNFLDPKIVNLVIHVIILHTYMLAL